MSTTLFDITPALPEGFGYYPDFITDEEEMRLVSEIEKTELNVFTFQGYEAKRKVASFGYDYHFGNRSLSLGKNIPEAFNFILHRVSEKINIPATSLAELLLTEYPPGAVINWHRDAPPFDIIAGISLSSDCEFKLRPHAKEKQSRRAVVSLTVKRKSLYIISGAARSKWQHSIAPVKSLRYSITLRTLRN